MPVYGRLHCLGIWWGAPLATLAVASALGLAPGHAQPAPAPQRPAATAIDRSSGEYLYQRHCSDCHGRDGRGTVIGFPLVGRPAGVTAAERIIDILRNPLQAMPAFPRDVVSDDAAKLIAHHIAVLESQASGAPIPPAPAVAVSAGPASAPLPSAPAVKPADPKTYQMREFASPCGTGHGVAVAPDGRVWYAGTEQHQLAMFDPKTEKFSCWKLPTRNARPFGIGIDRDGFVWLTLTGLPDNKIAMFDPTTELFTEYYLPHKPQPFLYPDTIAFDADQNPLFALRYGDGIGWIDRETGRLAILRLPGTQSRPSSIAIAKNGHVWVAEFNGNKIADIDNRTGRVTDYVHPRQPDDPGLGSLALDSKGNVWVSESEFGSIGLFDARSKKWRSWRAPANGGQASGIPAIDIDKQDNVWFSHAGGYYIGRFDTKNERFSVYPYATPQLDCRALDLAGDGSLWCIGSGASKLMQLSISRASN